MSVRSMFSRRVVVLLAALAVLTGVLLWTAPAVAAKKPVRLDHFWCYPVIDQPVPEPVRVEVKLQDQFDIRDGVVTEAWVHDPAWFCNPVAKKHKKRLFKIKNPEGHLTFYRLAVETEPGPERVIKYRNQFQRGRAVLGQPVMLAAPTIKGHDEQPPSLEQQMRPLDHFKCYEVLEAKPVKRRVGLRDQWQEEPKVRVGDAKLFCNPTRKWHDDLVVGVSNARGHLMCYVTEPVDPDERFKAYTLDQFGEHWLPLEDAQVLCVPTRKNKKWRTLD